MSSIHHLATSLRGHLFVAAEFKEVVYVWDIESGKLINQLQTHLDFGGHRLSISEDGSLCAAGAYNVHGIAVYDTYNGSLLWQRKDLKKVQWLQFSPVEQTLLAGFENKSLHILNSHTGETLKTFHGTRSCWRSPYEDIYLLEKIHLEIYATAKQKTVEKIDRNTFAVLDIAFGPEIVYISESGGPLRAISLKDASLIWSYQPEKGNHFLRIGYGEKCNTLFGISWPFVNGGAKTLWVFDSMTGKILNKTILEGQAIETEFARHGDILITSDGLVYNLAQCHKPNLMMKLEMK